MRRLLRLFIVLYGVALLASHLVRGIRPDASPRAHQETVLLEPVGGGEPGSDPVTMAFTDTGGTGPVLLLLHGSPLPSPAFDRIKPYLEDGYRLIIPDLPGFGGSSRRIPDYSVAAHGQYVVALLDSLDIASAHFVAYSMSGGVTLEAYGIAPERVASAVMLSAIGVQELELLGSYQLNHAVHAVQLGFLWVLQEGIPHFGRMDGAIINKAYARNFFDTDQRPLRSLLTRFEPPMLILHGVDDHFVPPAAALEHARIVPHSRLERLDGGHMLLFTEPEMVAGSILAFVHQVEEGAAPTLSDAQPPRRMAARASFDPTSVPKAGGLTLFILFLLIVLATFFSEDLTCIGSGMLVAQGTIGFIPATLACLTGIVAGDMGLYLLGKLARRATRGSRIFRFIIKKEQIQRGAKWLDENGPVVIVTSRFLPGTRLPTYTSAGFFGLGLARFSLYFLASAMLWTPILVGLSVIVGESFLGLFDTYQRFAMPLLLTIIAVVWVAVRMAPRLSSHRGRRLLLSRWRRLTRWEFWPIWAIYLPVAVYILYLAIRYRSLTVFTSANPGFDLGGLIGESKSDILRMIDSTGLYVPPFVLLDPKMDQRSLQLRSALFMTENNFTFPVVLKPDTGERGKGVAVIRSREVLDKKVSSLKASSILQAYAPGEEFGIFYYRYPEDETGAIYSITRKHMITVKGDGKRTLEDLILDDDRAVCMAGYFLRIHEERLSVIPAVDEEIPLVDVGTHARGALFLDDTDKISPSLTKAMHDISKEIRGFYFGRYDIRAENLAAIRPGGSFKIVELNGVTSEATHIYQPGTSLFAAWRTLMTQWRIAFEIGHQNRQQGISPVLLRTVIKRIASKRPRDAG